MAGQKKQGTYRFTFGPWNISTGADPFGPPVRKEVAFAAKIREYKKLGFDGVQFHDDDVVPRRPRPRRPRRKGVAEGQEDARRRGPVLRVHRPAPVGAPQHHRRRLHLQQRRATASTPSTAPSGPSTSPTRWAARTSSCGWPARAPTSARPRTPSPPSGRILDAVNALLEHDKNIRILGEMKPNEPMDQAYLPTPGHFLALCYQHRRSRRASAC